MFPKIEHQFLVRAKEAVPALHERVTEEEERQATISELIPYFLANAQFELRRSPETIIKYADCMKWVIRSIGDIPPGRIRQEHVLLVKAHCAKRNAGPSRAAGIIAALKSFLDFCQFTVGLQVMDTAQIHLPRIPKREVQFLTPEEVQQFVAAIPIRTSQRTFHMKWLCFRALVETILGTGMRISEALSMRRSALNIQTGEARVIGKGNKERTVFFSPRALNWIREYLTRRTDSNDALFTTNGRTLLHRGYTNNLFRFIRRRAGIKKKVTAHVLRHTMATTLLFNGCPIGHIKQLLGHENLQTTCKYYLGTDKRAAKEAQMKYLDYEAPRTDAPSSTASLI